MSDHNRMYWGQYCVVPRKSRYVHIVYPMSQGVVMGDDGDLRAMNAAELDQAHEQMAPVFARAFREG